MTFPRANARVLLCAVLAGSTLGLGFTAAYWAGAATGSLSHAASRSQARTTAPGAPMPAVPAAAARLSPAATAPVAARDVNCLTQAVYYEARGESARGQAAVAEVVMNRVRHPAFPKSVCAVVFQRTGEAECQFSFVCDGSMRQARDDAAWDRARAIATQVLSGSQAAQIGAATHFHAVRLGQVWGDGLVRVAQVGLHVFYRFGHHGPDAPAQGQQAAAGPAPDRNAGDAQPILAGFLLLPAAKAEAPARDADPLDEASKPMAAAPLASAAAKSDSPST